MAKTAKKFSKTKIADKKIFCTKAKARLSKRCLIKTWIVVSSSLIITLKMKMLLKVYSSHLNWGARLDSFDLMLNTRCPASFKFFFNDSNSREEHKTKYCGLTISKMTLSNQSHFPRWRTAVFLMLWCLKGGAYSPAGKGLGESQFRRLEKKLSTLPSLWYHLT